MWPKEWHIGICKMTVAWWHEINRTRQQINWNIIELSIYNFNQARTRWTMSTTPWSLSWQIIMYVHSQFTCVMRDWRAEIVMYIHIRCPGFRVLGRRNWSGCTFGLPYYTGPDRINESGPIYWAGGSGGDRGLIIDPHAPEIRAPILASSNIITKVRPDCILYIQLNSYRNRGRYKERSWLAVNSQHSPFHPLTLPESDLRWMLLPPVWDYRI